jgi:hypothetical protein
VGKRCEKIASGEYQGDERKRTADNVSKNCSDVVETRGVRYLWEESAGNLITAQAATGIEAA